MQTENMTRDQKIALLNQLHKELGWYPLLTLCVDDVREHIESGAEIVAPSDEVLHQSCAYVARKWDSGQEWMHALQWAAECCDEMMSKA